MLYGDALERELDVVLKKPDKLEPMCSLPPHAQHPFHLSNVGTFAKFVPLGPSPVSSSRLTIKLKKLRYKIQ